MIRTSIYGGSVAGKLLDALAASKWNGGGITAGAIAYSLRACTRKGVRSGGYVVRADLPKWEVGCNSGDALKLRIPAGKSPESLRRTIGGFATKVLRRWADEKIRRYHVDLVDAAAQPFAGDTKFLRYIDQKEKKLGGSRYDTMTVEQAKEWVRLINWWIDKHNKLRGVK